MEIALLIPTYNHKSTLAPLLDTLHTLSLPVIVVDDGSEDGTEEMVKKREVILCRHGENRGKGRALMTGLERAKREGFDYAIAIDADGQHYPGEVGAFREAIESLCQPALVLGRRDMWHLKEGRMAPWKSRLGLFAANGLYGLTTGHYLRDTQCGFRAYPVREVLALDLKEEGFGWETEVLLQAWVQSLSILSIPVEVYYPSPQEHQSYYQPLGDTRDIFALFLHFWKGRTKKVLGLENTLKTPSSQGHF